jgi:2-polyprenyl-3-methyl-5-hydroxy-6-metoxy-1,4-benzoquinol methylase
VQSQAIDRIIKSYDWGIIRLYSRIRFSILRQPFLEEIGQYLPQNGRILDLGCGFGLFSLYFALTAPGRSIVGIELDRRRVEYARASAKRLGLTNARYECGDAVGWRSNEVFDAIYLLDLIHHLPVEDVPGFLEVIRSRLRPGGILLVKDVSDKPAYKRLFTLFLDRLMVNKDPIRYWPPQELANLLEKLGFEVTRHQMKDFLPFPHVLYICRDQSQNPS